MKSQYAIFSRTGIFQRFEDLDPAEVPPIPLATDGLPRAVPTGTAPTITNAQMLTYDRTGWHIVDRDPAEVAAELLTAQERQAARDLIDEMTTIAQNGVATLAEANTAIRKEARGIRWLLRQALQADAAQQQALRTLRL